MKNKTCLFGVITRGFALATLLGISSARGLAAPAVTGVPFTQATITDLAGNVTVAPSNDPTAKSTAKLDDLFKAPDTLETGRKSRAQLTSADGTIARVGSNTAFSLEPNSRTIHLAQGSILFNSPKGIGGGTIETKSATATVLGTTIIVSATPDGGFKLLVLEGTATMKLPNGQTVTLTAGQMTFVLPASKGGGVGPVLNFDLKKEVASSNLVNGFTLSLPSQNLIVNATDIQQQKISTGDLIQTGQVVVGALSPDQVVLVDSTTFDNVNNVNNPAPPPTSGDLILGPTLGLPLPAANTFTSPGQTFTAAQLGLPSGVIPNNQATITGLIGGNVDASGYVDLSTLDGLNKVDILAEKTFTFTPSTTTFSTTITPGIDTPALDDSYNITIFTGLASTLHLNLIAFNGFAFAPNAEVGAEFSPPVFPAPPSISFDGGDGGDGGDDGDNFATPQLAVPQDDSSSSLFTTEFDLISVQADFQAGNVSFYNLSGSVHLESVAGDVYLNGTYVDAFTEAENGGADVSLQSTLGEVDLYDTHVFAGTNSTINVSALTDVNISSGNISSPTVLKTDFSAPYAGALLISAGNNITVANSFLSSASQNISAGGTLSMSNVTLNTGASYGGNYQFAGDTVNLSTINFTGCSTVNLYSKLGVLNTSGTPIAGDINFLSDVNYNNGPAWSEGQLTHGITLGVTADNPDVQTAGNEAVTLDASDPPRRTVPSPTSSSAPPISACPPAAAFPSSSTACWREN